MVGSIASFGGPEDSLHRNSSQIPFPGPPTAAQNHLDVIDEEETQSMRELVEAIDFHVEVVDLEATSNLRADDQPGDGVQLQPSTMIVRDCPSAACRSNDLIAESDYYYLPFFYLNDFFHFSFVF